jgi:predicted RNase H-like HicB family nuclease
MKDSARYAKIVEWSDEDQCYVGSAPDLIYGGCHGDDERAVFAELCDIVDEIIELHKQDGTPLPPPTSGRIFVGASGERSVERRRQGGS